MTVSETENEVSASAIWISAEIYSFSGFSAFSLPHESIRCLDQMIRQMSAPPRSSHTSSVMARRRKVSRSARMGSSS